MEHIVLIVPNVIEIIIVHQLIKLVEKIMIFVYLMKNVIFLKFVLILLLIILIKKQENVLILVVLKLGNFLLMNGLVKVVFLIRIIFALILLVMINIVIVLIMVIIVILNLIMEMKYL